MNPGSPPAVPEPLTPERQPSGHETQRERLWRLLVSKQAFLTTVFVAFLTVGLQLVQGVLLARLLGAEGRGEYATAVFWSHFLMYVGLFGCLELVCRYANNTTLDPMKIRRAALRLGLITGVVTMVTAILGSVLLIPQSKSYMAPVACLCSLSVLAQNVILIVTGVDRGAGLFFQFNLRRIVAAATLPVLVLLALPFSPMSVSLVCGLYVIGSYLTMWLCVYDISQPIFGESLKPTRLLLKEARPYAASMFVADTFDRLDLWLVLWLAPFTLQGYYATMVPVVYPLIVIPTTLGVFLFNQGAQSVLSLTPKGFLRTLGMILLVQLAMVGAFWLVARPVILLLYGSAFASAIPIALWLAPASACKGVIQGLEAFLKGRGRPQASIRARAFAAVLMVGMTLLLFHRYEVLALAMAAFVSQLVCLVWVAAIVYAEVKAHSQPHTVEATLAAHPEEC